MNRLLEIGFDIAGHWLVQDDLLRLELLKHPTAKNVLYALVVDGTVKYVGKTTQTLTKRMYGYQNPSSTQSTNTRNSMLLKQAIVAGSVAELLVLPDSGLIHYGQFHLNLAAGLEDSLISIIKPEWNGMRLPPEDPDGGTTVKSTFSFTLQKTYWEHGFFNVPVEFSEFLGGDAERIEIAVERDADVILGVINRRSNNNGSPRIFGGTGLRNWFQSYGTLLAPVTVNVLSSCSIKLSVVET